MTTAAGRSEELLLQALERVVRHAGELILQVYGSPFEVLHKSDASPVTEADERAEACITAALHGLEPGVPVVAEEAAAKALLPAAAARFWLVDPLDGTREFVARNGEFTVNVALVEDGLPVLGLVYAPVSDALYLGGTHRGAWQHTAGVRRRLQGRPLAPQAVTLACSRSHGDDAALQQWLQAPAQSGLQVVRRVAVGSSLKFGLLAAGEADVYPRFGPTMEWDTAAGHAVLRASGGDVLALDGQTLRYGKPGFCNPHFVAWGRR
jgi:3'(2'), 5'-bisphosphate nucleotidase